MATLAPERTNHALIGMIVAVATIGGFMFGYDSGVVNGTQAGLKATFQLSDNTLGLVVASLLIGCAVGAYSAGRLADQLGRRAVMMIAAVCFLISAIAAGFSTSATFFVVARLLGGFGVGAASVLCPAYIAEVTPAHVRGRLTSVQQIMIITGLTGAFVANYFLAQAAGESTAPFWSGYAAWRWMFWMQAIPATLFLVTLLLIPESPRFLMVKGREQEAHGVLGRLFGTGAADRKVQEIRQSLAADHHKPKLSDLVDKRTGRIRLIVWAGVGLAIFQQLVGINVVFYYGAVLWQSVGFTEADSLKINILSGSLSILACLFTILTVDRIGRKPLLLIGSAGMAVTLGIVAWCFHQGVLDATGAVHLPPNVGKIALISANAYVVFFNASWGPVMWVMLGEMFPNQIRGSGLAVAGFFQWIANFAISASFPHLAVSPGLTVTYTGYALAAFVSFFFVQALVRETRGRELEAMEG